MNRLVIIGNGFDLAHGLPTGYCDFLNYYWRNVIDALKQKGDSKRLYEDDLISVIINLSSMHHSSIYNALEEVNSFKSLMDFFDDYKYKDGYENFLYRIDFKCQFLKNICEKQSIQNWVDIENEYYFLLKECLKDNNNTRVKELNQEFDRVKCLLENYLYDEVASKFDYSEDSNISQFTNIFDLYNRLRHKDKFLEEFGYNVQEQIKEYLNAKGTILINKENKEKNLFLNFNYTPTADIYATYMNASWRDDYGQSEVIQIHGKLKDIKNPINFGFGDEMDDDYKTIEKKDDNEYLKNIKSFQYLQNSNYKKMLNFVESNPFQVYIMGHSCGLSDRILLNRIFEHRNCLSIKVFYYKNGNKDNYTELIQNISRHFNQKEMMRERIVNKTLCEPLPQTKLPLK
ncbi:hypothetical protein HYN59_03645 [Flavobacterium album]|uniref:Bacteriophage abortive infection AbiH n=1 Tax=Flavobacterium album TaxID=2175091 RepID=A0A2S1QVL3_9FLAO|nr:AbiH family protein [Flavobacterium album]AWH84261.1 hypothetical protein HYN59_03645 [Flavobacterium album]